MLPLARRYVALAAVAFLLGAACVALVATDEARRRAACAEEPGWSCDLGALLLTDAATYLLAPLVVVGLVLLAFARRAQARQEEPDSYAARPPALALGLLAALAAAVGLVGELALRGCAADVACIRTWLPVEPHAWTRAVVLAVAAVLVAIEGARRGTRAGP